jgi:hypothetical protein
MHPLGLDEALRGAMLAGPSPENRPSSGRKAKKKRARKPRKG